MEHQSLLVAALLGVLEGLTEFIPVSSTGHILLAGHFLGFQSDRQDLRGADPARRDPGDPFGLCRPAAGAGAALPSDPKARRFVAAILLAFLPAVVIGVLAHGFIKTVLFETPALIAVMLILGGIVLLWVDRRLERPEYHDVMDFPLPLAFKIGLFQCLAMIPGVSRSGATIVGALLMGADKRSAAEFSFFLSMPTMAGAFAFDLYKNRDALSFDDATIIAVGFVCRLCLGGLRGARVARFRLAAGLRDLRLVANRGRLGGAGGALADGQQRAG